MWVLVDVAVEHYLLGNHMFRRLRDGFDDAISFKTQHAALAAADALLSKKGIHVTPMPVGNDVAPSPDPAEDVATSAE